MTSFEDELKQEFLIESEDLLLNAENAFLRLESERNNPDLLNEIFRLAHNLKGTSKAVGFDQMSHLTHKAENLILKLKDGSLQVSDQVISVLLVFKDKINEMINSLKENFNNKIDVNDLEQKIEAAINGENTNGPNYNKEESAELELPQDEIKDNFAQTLEQKNEESEIKSIIKELEKSLPIENNLQEQVTKSNQPKNNNAEIDDSIRVSLKRIDKINNVIGELVILQTVISQRRFQYIKDDLSNKSIGMMSKLFKEVQELAMSLRMIPLKNTFQKMNRIVRDTSKMLGKEVNLNLIGEETEVDKTVLEKLSDPLVHIVRNSVDHGLESPEKRLEVGKNKIGQVELMAFHEGSHLVIQVTDDGKGIDPEIIRKKAKEKGIIHQNANLSDQDLINLIFHPGFSTKDEVTEVSGRGVGMDVVKTNIESLGGEIKILSKLGEGTSLKITLPLTLAIIEGIVILATHEKYVLPLNQIHEIIQVKADEIESFSGIANLFKVRGEVYPLFFLNEKLGMKRKEDSHITVIVVKGSNCTFGVQVDDILNQQQIVIKKLGDDIKGKKGIMGSAIMSDGKPSLIIDLVEIFKDDIKKSRGYKQFLDNNNNKHIAA